MKKLQYMVIPHGERMGVANVFATEVVEYGEGWMFSVGELVGAVWRNRGTLQLCAHSYADAAAQGRYPVFSIGNFWRWPTRGAKESA